MDTRENYQLLGNAIVKQACEDYQEHLLLNEKYEVFLDERFFRSDYFCLLTDLDPEYLMNEIREKVDAIRRKR